MSNELIFNIIPFDPMIVPNIEINLPNDFDDFTRQLRGKVPNAEIIINENMGDTILRLYIKTEKYGVWNIATYIKDYSQFSVTGWPRRLARELIFWYRQYIPMEYQLFLTIPSTGYVAELTGGITLNDIDKMYPFPVADD